MAHQTPPDYTDARAYYEPHRDVYVDARRPGNKDTSIKSVTVPIVLAISAAAALVVITAVATNQLSEIKYSILQLSSKVGEMRDSLTTRLHRVELEIDQRTADRWSKTDHAIWCARTEILNTDIGWKCGGYDSHTPPRKKISKPSPEDWRPKVN